MIAPFLRLSKTIRGLRSLAAAGVLCVLLGAGAPASGATLVVFTIDVESNQRFHLPDQIDAVCADGSSCGLMEIVRVLGERRLSGTFFLDVYEQRQWGEAAMRALAVRLQAAGQDVALHTHPQWAYDSSRWAMHQYSLDEQTAIIRDGAGLLQAWTGRPVVAHRAGAYTADENTLIALERQGVLLDSSLFWKDPNSRLDNLGLARNLPSWHGRVAEIPVTAYQRDDRPAILGAALSPTSTIRKIDPNWFVDSAEARTAIDAEVAANVPVLVVFLHSFSFMGAPTAGGPPVADRQALDLFRVIVDEISDRKLGVVTMRDLAGRVAALSLPASDAIPRVSVRVDLLRYVWRRAKAVDALLFGLGAVLAVLCACVVVAVAIRRLPWRAGDKRRLADASASAGGGRVQ